MNLINKLGNQYLSGECFTFPGIKALYIPVLLEQISMTITSVINSILVSGSGEAVFAAVSIFDTINIFLMNIFIAIATGGSIVVAQYIGRKDPYKVEQSVVQTMVSTTLIATAMGLFIIIFNKPILTLLFGKSDPEVMRNVLIYTVGCCISYPLSGIYNSTIGVMRGSGKTKVSAQLVLLTTIVNLSGSFIFIKIFGMGIYGVILALFATRVLGMFASIFAVSQAYPNIKDNFKSYIKIDKGIQRSILFVGIPSAIEQLFFHGGRIVMQTFVVSMGTQMVTVNAIGNAIYNILYVPGNAISICLATVVGTCIGAKKPEEAKRFVKNMSLTGMGLLTATCLCVLPILPYLIGMYTESAEVTEMSYQILLIALVATSVIWSASFSIPSGLRAAGDVKFVTGIALTTMWTIRISVGYVLGIVLELGVLGIWLAMFFEWIFRAAIFILRFKGNKWLQHNIIK